MFSHVMIGANDVSEAKVFYDAILGALGYEKGKIDPATGRCFYITQEGILAITKPINGEPASHGNGMTIGFSANNPEQVDAWHVAGLSHGGVDCEDAPGMRHYGEKQLYLAYLKDPSGNKICALYRVPK